MFHTKKTFFCQLLYVFNVGYFLTNSKLAADLDLKIRYFSKGFIDLLRNIFHHSFLVDGGLSLDYQTRRIFIERLSCLELILDVAF